MDSPIYDVTYTNECNLDISFLIRIAKYYRDRRYDFFSGLCYTCHSERKTLNRCGGCQLVSYCSKECQKKDRSSHKYICKEFPVVDEKSVLYTKRPWKEHIAGLIERAAQLPQPHAEKAKFIFYNPRVCNKCRDPCPGKLKGCTCVCVSYCSQRCKTADKTHVKDCPALNLICRAHIMLIDEKPYPPNFDHIHLWKKFVHIYKYEDVIILPDLPTKDLIENFAIIEFYNQLFSERLSYAMSLLYALQTLPHLSHFQSPLGDLTSLCIHVVISIPLFDSLPWETFLHRLPNLRQLEVVFILQGNIETPPLNYTSNWNIQRCKDCKDNDRVITYSIQKKWYHMFFSSVDYTEPDIVAIFGNSQKMLAPVVDNVHSEMSYRNMTDSVNTVLVLTDTTEKLVKQGTEAVKVIRPIEQIARIQKNPFSGFSTDRAELGSNVNIMNEKSYFTCIKRK